MQIFEITQGPISEGILRNIGRAVGSAATAAMAKSLQTSTGIDFEPKKNPYGAKQSQAAAAAKPVIEQQAKEEHKKWIRGITQTMQAAGKTSVADLDGTPEKTEIERSLLNQINTGLLRNKTGRDYKSLPSFVDSSMSVEAQNTVAAITKAKDDLMNFLAPNYDQHSLQAWKELSQAAYDAMALVQFTPSRYSTGAQATLTNLGLNTRTIAGLKTEVSTNATDPISAMPAGSPTTSWLAAFGFKPWFTGPTAVDPGVKSQITRLMPAPVLDTVQRTVSSLPGTVSSGDDAAEDWAVTLGFRP